MAKPKTDEERKQLATRLEKRVDSAGKDLLEATEEIGLLMWAVTRAAARYWEGLQPEDFCVQYISIECIIFGGTNRLIWRPETGFFPDCGYCTQEFLANCCRLGHNPGRE